MRSSMLFLPDIGSVSVDGDGYEADEGKNERQIDGRESTEAAHIDDGSL